jgi:hypothetical protein
MERHQAKQGCGRTQEPFIEILPGRPERPYRDLGPIEAGAGNWAGGVTTLIFKGKT